MQDRSGAISDPPGRSLRACSSIPSGTRSARSPSRWCRRPSALDETGWSALEALVEKTLARRPAGDAEAARPLRARDRAPAAPALGAPVHGALAGRAHALSLRPRARARSSFSGADSGGFGRSSSSATTRGPRRPPRSATARTPGAGRRAGMNTKAYDVVVIGSGAGGGTVAEGLGPLARAGYRDPRRRAGRAPRRRRVHREGRRHGRRPLRGRRRFPDGGRRDDARLRPRLGRLDGRLHGDVAHRAEARHRRLARARPRARGRRAPLAQVHGREQRPPPRAGPPEREQPALRRGLHEGGLPRRAVPAQPPRLQGVEPLQPRLPEQRQAGHAPRPASGRDERRRRGRDARRGAAGRGGPRPPARVARPRPARRAGPPSGPPATTP